MLNEMLLLFDAPSAVDSMDERRAS